MANQKGGKNQSRNPRGFLEGLRQIIQDLLVPELKAIQVTLQHHGELIQSLQRQMDERFKKVDEQFNKVDERFNKIDERFNKVDEEFTKVWQAINELVEAQRHTQMILQRILDRLDVTEAVRETQSRQKVMEAQVEDLRDQVQYLRSLMEMLLRQRGVEPPPP